MERKASSSLRIQVLRDACCSQDDQMGPLEHVYELSPDAQLSDLVHAVTSSGFLQYSSTHTTLTGFFGDTPFVTVFSDYYRPGRLPEYAIPAVAALAPLIKGRMIEFRFGPQTRPT